MRSPGTRGTPATSPIPWRRSPPTPSAFTTCSATWPSGSRGGARTAVRWCAADRGPTRRARWARGPAPGRRRRGIRPIPNSPRAVGGSPTRRSSASASYSFHREPVMTRKHRRAVTRREFLETTAAATAAVTLPYTRGPALVGKARKIRVGVIGCGGRGTGAMHDCLTSSEDVELVALGDLFPDRLAKCRENLATMVTEEGNAALKPKIKVNDAHCFTGFDAYQKVIASKVDLVVLATPPAFRATHFAAAVAAGKHVFIEKPVAVDPSGVRSVIATADLAAQKGLAVVAGT